MNDTNRQALKKIHNWTKWELTEFLDAHPKCVSLKALQAEQKFDGQAFRFGIDEEGLFFESAYSGIQRRPSWFRDERLRDFAQHIEFKNGCWAKMTLADCCKAWGFKYFKLCGELIYPLDPNDATIVITRYNSHKVNPYKFIVYDVEFDSDDRIEDNELHISNKGGFIRILREYSFLGHNVVWHKHFMARGVVRYPEVQESLSKDWKFARFELAKAFSDYIRYQGEFSYIDRVDGIPEGYVFQFNGRRYAASNFAWLKAKELKYKHD